MKVETGCVKDECKLETYILFMLDMTFTGPLH